MQMKVEIKEIKQKSVLLEQVRGMNFVTLITNIFLKCRSAKKLDIKEREREKAPIVNDCSRYTKIDWSSGIADNDTEINM